MDQLFNIGKNLFGGGNKKNDNNNGGIGGAAGDILGSLTGGGSDGDGIMNSVNSAMTIFKQLDRNGDGNITEDDFVIGIEKLGMGKVGELGVRQAFKQIDTNGNGKLEISEALAAFEKVKALFDKTGGNQ